MPKMHQVTFDGRAPPGPAGELMLSPRPPVRDGGLLIGEEGKGREGRGLHNKGGSNTPHRYGNSRAIWDQTVLPATRQR